MGCQLVALIVVAAQLQPFEISDVLKYINSATSLNGLYSLVIVTNC
jgi:hypothetical protein